MIFLNIIVLVFEVLFYSLFMKYSRKDGKLINYLFLFTIGTIIVTLFSSKYMPTYLIFIITMFVGLKYIVRTKVSLYDLLIIIVMLLLNVVIELPIFIVFYNLFHFNHFIVTLIFELVKLLIILLAKFKLNEVYLKGKKIWNNNNFNIRYVFTILIYLYVIITIALLIKTIWR